MAKKYQVEKEVFRAFRRVMKDNKSYWYFLSGVQMKAIQKFLRSMRNPLANKMNMSNEFIKCVNTAQVLETMSRLSGQMLHGDSKSDDIHEVITINVNHLLHNFVEGQNGINMNTLSSVGQKIYDMVCESVLGEVHEDTDVAMAANEINDAHVFVSPIEAAYTEWRERTRNGELGGMSFADYFGSAPADEDFGVVDENGFMLGDAAPMHFGEGDEEELDIEDNI